MKKDSGFCMDTISQGGKIGSLAFCRKNMPVIKKSITYKGEECEVFEGSFYIARNLQVKVYVKPDGYETDKGNEIAYRVTISGFKTEPNSKVKTGRDR